MSIPQRCLREVLAPFVSQVPIPQKLTFYTTPEGLVGNVGEEWARFQGKRLVELGEQFAILWSEGTNSNTAVALNKINRIELHDAKQELIHTYYIEGPSS